jgi:hypothetical protein
VIGYFESYHIQNVSLISSQSKILWSSIVSSWVEVVGIDDSLKSKFLNNKNYCKNFE